MPLDLVINGLLAVLLAVTVVYCWILNRKLGRFRNAYDQLAELIQELTVVTQRAEGSLAGFKTLGVGVIGDLDQRIKTAKTLSDELSIMVEVGSNLADRLERRPALQAGDIGSGHAAESGHAADNVDQSLVGRLRDAR